MKKIIAVLAFELMLSGVVSTASAVETRGAPSCGKWVEKREIAINESTRTWSTLIQERWLTGYLSGISVESDKNFLKGTDYESLNLWMDNYCKENPLKTVDEGGYYLFLELVKQKNL